MQNGVAGGHAVVHAPQLTALERYVSHPVSNRPSQSAKPVSHAAIAHASATQVAVAWGSTQGRHAAEPHP